jgi:2-keto-4-pentenoate hydratase
VPLPSIADILASIDYAVAAIEIVGSRIENWNIKILDTIADNASAGLFVLGSQPRRLADFDPVLCGMVIEKGGEPISTGAGMACLGNPLTATLWLAKKMVEVGRPLKKGDLVMSGALGPLAAISAGDSIELRISGLGSVRAHF